MEKKEYKQHCGRTAFDSSGPDLNIGTTRKGLRWEKKKAFPRGKKGDQWKGGKW